MDWAGDHSSVVGLLPTMYEALHSVSEHHREETGGLPEKNTINDKSSKLRKQCLLVVQKTLQRECHTLTVGRNT